MVHTHYTLPLPSGSGCFPASSNGLASGNHILEAINHGICEVVERDADQRCGIIWTRQARAARALDLEHDRRRRLRRVLAQLERAEFAVAVWDATTDVGIAAFYCLITDRRHEHAHSGAGAGRASRARGRAAAGVDRGDPGAHHLHHRLARRPAPGRVHAAGASRRSCAARRR